MIKPDGVQRGLVGDIIKRFEQRGYQLKALKLFQASEELLRKHYCDLVEKKFFPALLDYMVSGPVACMVWEGEDAVKMGRQMLGATNPQDSLPGTIRGDFSIVYVPGDCSNLHVHVHVHVHVLHDMDMSCSCSWFLIGEHIPDLS